MMDSVSKGFFLCIFLAAQSAHCLDPMNFEYHQALDQAGKYHIFWTPEDNLITLEIQVTSA